MRACVPWMSAAETSVRVSRGTLEELERMRDLFGARTADETIRRLLRERRDRAIDRLFGSGKDDLTPFTESDRLETHD